MDSNINKLKKIINSKRGDDEYMDDKDILYKKIREVKGDPVFADLISENGYKTEQEESPVSWLMIDIAELMRVIDRHEAMGNHHYSEELEDFAGFLIKIMEITA